MRASKAEAAKALRELVASAQAGPAFGVQASVSTLLDTWIAAKETRWSKSTLRDGLIDAAGGPVLQERKTKNANCVDLDVETLELLRAHREQCAKRAAAKGVPMEGCPLFSTAADVTTSWKPNWVTKRFGVALDHAGVDHFRLHDLRHFVATQMLGSGVALPVVSARLGHARASTTLNIYAASMPAWDRAAAEMLSTLLRAS